MRKLDQTRAAAWAVLAAVAGTASAGIAALARAGVCLHQLGLFGRHPVAMDGMAMGAMTMDPSVGGPCPILLWTAAGAGALCLAALIAILVVRPRAADLAVASAKLVLGLRLAPTAALLAVAGAIPLAVALAFDGATGGIAPYVAAVALAVSALLGAGALSGIARIILACARRIVVALLAAPRWLRPDSDVPWLSRPALVPIPSGTRLARRRPSRAPPIR